MELIIRYGRQSEMQNIEKLNAEAIRTLRKTYKPKEKIDANSIVVDKSNENILVATFEDEIVGTAKVSVIDNRIHIKGLGVAEKYRRKGITKSIIDFLKNEIKIENVSCISLYTIRETGNVDVFSGLGFSVINEVKTDAFESSIFDILHEVYMEMYIGEKQNRT